MEKVFVTKCYNGHKMLLDEELDGETVECPMCGEDFIAASNFEELGKVDETSVPYHTRGYIHMGMGLLIGLLLTYLIEMATSRYNHIIWRSLSYSSLSIGGLYFFRGVYELLRDRDPFVKINQWFFAGYYILWKKIKFFRR